MAVADAKLVEQTLSGDLDGFGELHRRYYQRAVHVVYGIVRDRIQAEDMVQDAYLTALNDLAQLRDPNRFYPWLCRIAVNRAIDFKRRTARRAEIEADRPHQDRTPPDAEARLFRHEQAEMVKTALERLPERQRAAVTLRFFDELPMRSIAEICGVNEVTARTQVFRGLRKLGVYLKARKGDSR